MIATQRRLRRSRATGLAAARRGRDPVHVRPLPRRAVHARAGLRGRRARPEPAGRLRRPDLARARRLLRARRLHGRAPDREGRRPAPRDRAGGRRGLLRRRASSSACRRCACAASTSRSSRSGLAIAMPQLIKRFDGLTEGTQGLNVAAARRARLGCRSPTTSSSTCSRWSWPSPMFVLAGEPRPRPDRAGARWRCATARSPRRRMGVDLARLKTQRLRGQRACTRAWAARSTSSRSASSRPSRSRSRSRSRSWRRSWSAGWRRSAGAVFGALFIEFVPVYASDVNDALAGVIYGAVLIAFMYVLPGGVMGVLRQIGGCSRQAFEGSRRAARQARQAGRDPAASDRPPTRRPALKGS